MVRYRDRPDCTLALGIDKAAEIDSPGKGGCGGVLAKVDSSKTLIVIIVLLGAGVKPP